MINRFDLIDDFLINLSTYALSNDDLKITKELVYANLVNFGVDKATEIKECFPLWIETFKFKKNIKVYEHTGKDNCFCLFENNKHEIMDRNCFKIYVPQDEKHIFKSAKLLFSFLAEKNITHASKISKDIRLDDIVIRVNNKDEANVVNSFIKENEYIQDGMLRANPFAFQFNNTAFAIDRKISYNSEVSYLIATYITNLKHKNRLSTASSFSFKSFLKDYYNETFIKGANLNNFIKVHEELEKKCNKEGLKNNKLEQLIDYKDVINLISNAMDSKNDFMSYMNHYDEINTREYEYAANLAMNDLLVKVYGTEDVTEPMYTLRDKERVLQESIIATIKKYNMKQGKEALNKYVYESKSKGFTKDLNARQNVISIVSPKDAMDIIKNFYGGELNLDKYVEITMNVNLTKIKKDLLDRAIKDTYFEKGETFVKETLEALIKHQNIDDLKNISNRNESRRNFYKFIELNEIESLIKQILVDEKFPGSLIQEKYIDLYVQRIKKIY